MKKVLKTIYRLPSKIVGLILFGIFASTLITIKAFSDSENYDMKIDKWIEALINFLILKNSGLYEFINMVCWFGIGTALLKYWLL